MKNYENAEALKFSNKELQKVKISKIRLDDLIVNTGSIVVCDPLVQPDRSALPISVPAGKYPVELYQSNNLVGFVDVCFRNDEITHWLFEDFSVDTGYAAVMDQLASFAIIDHDEMLQKKLGDDYISYYDDFFTEINPTDIDYFSFRPMDNVAANVTVFRSGYGDGIYVAWMGLNAKNECVRVVVDVGTITNSDGRSDYDRATEGLISGLTEEQKILIQKAHDHLSNNEVAALEKLLDDGLITVETYIPSVGANLIFEAIRLNKTEAFLAIIDQVTSMNLPDYLVYDEAKKSYLDYALFIKKRPSQEILKSLEAKIKR